MILYAIATKHRTHDYWTMDVRMWEDRTAAETWAAETWGGTGCETRLMALPRIGVYEED